MKPLALKVMKSRKGRENPSRRNARSAIRAGGATPRTGWRGRPRVDGDVELSDGVDVVARHNRTATLRGRVRIAAGRRCWRGHSAAGPARRLARIAPGPRTRPGRAQVMTQPRPRAPGWTLRTARRARAGRRRPPRPEAHAEAVQPERRPRTPERGLASSADVLGHIFDRGRAGPARGASGSRQDAQQAVEGVAFRAELFDDEGDEPEGQDGKPACPPCSSRVQARRTARKARWRSWLLGAGAEMLAPFCRQRQAPAA